MIRHQLTIEADAITPQIPNRGMLPEDDQADLQLSLMTTEKAVLWTRQAKIFPERLALVFAPK